MKRLNPNIQLILEIIEEGVSIIKKFPNNSTVLKEQRGIIDTRIKELVDISKGER